MGFGIALCCEEEKILLACVKASVFGSKYLAVRTSFMQQFEEEAQNRYIKLHRDLQEVHFHCGRQYLAVMLGSLLTFMIQCFGLTRMHLIGSNRVMCV